MIRRLILWTTTVLAAVHPFLLLAAFANLYRSAIFCLGHLPRFMVDDPKNICSLNPAYQGAWDLLTIAVYIVPVSVFMLGYGGAKWFPKKPAVVAVAVLVHLSGWVCVYRLAGDNRAIVDGFMD